MNSMISKKSYEFERIRMTLSRLRISSKRHIQGAPNLKDKRKPMLVGSTQSGAGKLRIPRLSLLLSLDCKDNWLKICDASGPPVYLLIFSSLSSFSGGPWEL